MFKQYHLDRLIKWRDFMKTVKPSKFDFSDWGTTRTGANGEPNVCGTTACGLGWAGSMPAFRKRGLRLEFNKEDYGDEDIYVSGDVVLLDKDGNSLYGEEAGAEFFGLEESEAYHLFIPGFGCGGESEKLKDYVKAISKFIDGKKKELAAERKYKKKR